MPRLFTNNAATTLASGISSSATTITVSTGKGALFPNPTGADYFDLTLTQAGTETSWEVVRCSVRTGDTLSVTRGIEGAPAAWAAGDKVELRMTAATLSDFGFRNLQQLTLTGSYTPTLNDTGLALVHDYNDTGSLTLGIPDNSVTPFAVGTMFTIINPSGAGFININILTDTMKLAGTASTGNRVLQANGIATLVKVKPTEWMITGSNIT